LEKHVFLRKLIFNPDNPDTLTKPRPVWAVDVRVLKIAFFALTNPDKATSYLGLLPFLGSKLTQKTTK
jgi:hypothetical protein